MQVRLVASRYNVVTPAYVSDVALAFNTASGSFAPVHGEQRAIWQDILSADHVIWSEDASNAPSSQRDEVVDFMFRNGFLVPEEVDELARMRQRYWSGRKAGQSGHLSLTVSPTVACNFRCGYCFQEHPQRRMQEPDRQALVRFVEANLVEGGSLGVMWFGGEPVLAFDALIELAQALQEVAESRGASYSHSMITNGSLLTREKAERMCAIARPGFVQITLDGDAESHDRRRHTVGGKGTFDGIVANLKEIAGVVPVTIRMNVDKTNVNRIEPLVVGLEEEGLKDRLSVYLGHVQEFTEACDEMNGTDLTIQEFAEAEANLGALLLCRGWSVGGGLPRPPSGPICTADNPNGYVISPGGLVFRCWNEAAQGRADAWGHLSDDGALAIRRRSHVFEDFDAFSHEACASCRVAPLCRGGCPWEATKYGPEETGHCTPMRFNLEDKLRAYHLRTSIRRSAEDPAGALSDDEPVPQAASVELRPTVSG